MPTVLRTGPYRCFFNNLENDEPPHIHVERDDDMANTGWNRLHSLQITVFGLTN